MKDAFVVWTLVFLTVCGIAAWCFSTDKPVHFFTGASAPDVKDVKKFNKAVGKLWLLYALVLELLGLPLVLGGHKWLSFIIIILGTVFSSIVLAAAYTEIESRHRK
ncbi:MAG: hypothetical protein IJJ00_05935 [Erysipelotrichaceae bacterium]|nr:hypothetical protein [Erysipelotrichaceae bacterium]